MASCMHHGEGCSPKGTPLHKCSGYYEHSFGCEHYVCENHAHRNRYGVFCAECDPAPPAFDTPRAIKRMYPIAVMAANTGIRPSMLHHR